ARLAFLCHRRTQLVARRQRGVRVNQWLVLLAVGKIRRSQLGDLCPELQPLVCRLYQSADVVSGARCDHARGNDTGAARAVGVAMTIACPALLVSAPASGSGKTSVTAALARHHARNGLRVRCFKAGPDFIDPTILVQASGQPVYNLDPWIMGVEHCRQLLCEAAEHSDLILGEGVMGLHDGDPSSADLAQVFGLPLLLVIDASAMAQTFGALVHGLSTYREDLRVHGVIANRVG